MNRYRIRCRYVGDDAYCDEARAFVCGAVAVLIGPCDYRLPSGEDSLFNVYVFAATPPKPAALGLLRSACDNVLPSVLMELGARVEIGAPEIIVEAAPAVAEAER